MTKASTYINVDHVKENATLASYGFGILSKGQKLTSIFNYLYRDIARLTDSRITHLFMQLQAGFSIRGGLYSNDFTPTCSAYFSFSNISHIAKDYIHQFTEHPISKFATSFFFYKQTLDFAIASYEWVTKSRSSKSLLNQTVNTTLAYIPVIAGASSLSEDLSVQLAMNALTIGCLAYSIRQDFICSTNSKLREPSPSILMLRLKIIPKIQSFSQKFWS